MENMYSKPIANMTVDFQRWVDRVGLKSKSHQVDGFKWCAKQEMDEEGWRDFMGGILADEMGLGKTILMLGLMVCNPKKKTLIVLPPALLQQWVDAIEKYCPSLSNAIHVWHGAKNTNDDAFELCDSSAIKVVLTTYGMLSMRRIENYCCDLWLLDWDRIIYDEAHHLRNSNTNLYRGIEEMHNCCASAIFWFVSGTPINNNLGDVKALLSLAGVVQDVLVNDEILEETLDDKLLRRTKKSIGIDLPDYKEKIVPVAFKGTAERNLAELIHNELNFSQMEVNENTVDICIDYLSRHMFGILARAKQMCIDPQMACRGLFKAGANANGLLSQVRTNSKIDAVVEQLKQNEFNGESKIVFCFYRSEMDKFEKILEKDFVVEKIDGRSSKKERNSILLRDNIDILLIQIQTGCEGLNLQQYSEIYFTSPHWNPAVEDQAIARAHRMGQEKQVNVYRFISKFEKGCTIDSYCKMVQSVKRDMQNKFIKVNNRHNEI
jgi:SNF2 family DNA or RNA helicase